MKYALSILLVGVVLLVTKYVNPEAMEWDWIMTSIPASLGLLGTLMFFFKGKGED